MPEVLLLAAGADKRAVAIAAKPGETVLAAMLRAGARIQTVCKGKGICGACRVAVEPEFAGRLNPASATEARMLKYLRSREEDQTEVAQRLACQIVLEPSVSGLRITPDPVRPRILNQEKLP